MERAHETSKKKVGAQRRHNQKLAAKAEHASPSKERPQCPTNRQWLMPSESTSFDGRKLLPTRCNQLDVLIIARQCRVFPLEAFGMQRAVAREKLALYGHGKRQLASSWILPPDETSLFVQCYFFAGDWPTISSKALPGEIKVRERGIPRTGFTRRWEIFNAPLNQQQKLSHENARLPPSHRRLSLLYPAFNFTCEGFSCKGPHRGRVGWRAMNAPWNVFKWRRLALMASSFKCGGQILVLLPTNLQASKVQLVSCTFFAQPIISLLTRWTPDT